MRGVHGEKLVAALESDKLPVSDKPRLSEAIVRYDTWIDDLSKVSGTVVSECIEEMVEMLNSYKNYIDIDLIFDSPENFLYRQKGQLKLDNTVIEEFLPIMVKACLERSVGDVGLDIGAQVPTFSSAFFESSIGTPAIGGGLTIRAKDQDFSMSRKLYIQSSYEPDFIDEDTLTITTHVGYVLAELKTNLDKTMFQEASATAHDVKLAVSGAKYYLLCDFLDMTPISTGVTDIDEILIARKAKRINSNIRKNFSTYEGRLANRNWYVEYLQGNPYYSDVFERFMDHILSQIQNEDLVEESVLDMGYF
ncbi:MAG: Bpu10I family restriction endonuclease [Coriobacteriales bacterium]|jgi:hypothetical protein|nr:Bpu10I family restriction endonuclease [Coriobacteriales bacterium]